uniref:Uncharacterized protein n=1 Tax=Anguilla anguilla TaxID=7936 RepID=A0A0E9VBE8_ANGAN
MHPQYLFVMHVASTEL